MVMYLFILVLSVLVFPLAWRRSRSMTRYVAITGAPLIWVLLALVSAGSAIMEWVGQSGTALGLLTGGLIGTAFVQVTLVRRGLSGPDSPLK